MAFGIGGGGLLGGVTGGLFGSGVGAANDAIETLQGVQLPKIEQMKIYLEEQVQQGKMTPEEAKVYLQEQSRMEDIEIDPSLRAAQMDALAGLQEVVDQDGMDARSRARVSQIQNDVMTSQRGNREAILQNQRSRGLGGSGMELAAQLQSQQAGANQASQMAMAEAALAEQRKMEALRGMADMGTSIRGQDFGEQERIAKAADYINQFNTNAKQQTGNFNTSNRNRSQEYNLNSAQRIADNNTNIRNEQEQFNKGLVQQNFNNQIQKAGGVADAYFGKSKIDQEQSKRDQEFTGSMLEGAGSFINSDKNLKKDVERFDAESFLNELTGYKYNYKKPEKHGQGEQVGIMAQDLERTEVGPMLVENSPEGNKGIDYSKAGGPIFASLASLNERLKELEGK